MYTAAAAMRPYKLEKQIAFLLPHVSFRDEDDHDEDDVGGGGSNDEDAVTAASSLSLADNGKAMLNDCGDSMSSYDQHAADMLYEPSGGGGGVMMDKACNEHDALDHSIHFLCEQRYKVTSSTSYKWVDVLRWIIVLGSCVLFSDVHHGRLNFNAENKEIGKLGTGGGGMNNRQVEFR